jgi:hypothetical protein
MSTRAAEVENEPDKLVRWGLLVVGLACIVASGDVLVYVAHRAGWDGWRAYMLPVLIDLPGFLGGRIWLRRARTSTDTRRYARGLTLAALSVSIVGNAIGHLVKSGHLTPGVALVILTGIVAPVVLWAVLHLDALLTPTVPVAVPDAAPVPAPVAQPSQRIVPGPAKPKPAKKAAPKPSPDKTITPALHAVHDGDEDGKVSPELVELARKLDEEYEQQHGRPISRDKARPVLGVSNEKTGKALSLAREGVA